MIEAKYAHLNLALSGSILLGYWAIGVFFFRFYRRNGDRFFIFFGCGFWLLAIERILLLAIGAIDEIKAYVYLLRLVAFLFILYAIFDKNRSAGLPEKNAVPKNDRQ